MEQAATKTPDQSTRSESQPKDIWAIHDAVYRRHAEKMKIRGDKPIEQLVKEANRR